MKHRYQNAIIWCCFFLFSSYVVAGSINATASNNTNLDIGGTAYFRLNGISNSMEFTIMGDNAKPGKTSTYTGSGALTGEKWITFNANGYQKAYTARASGGGLTWQDNVSLNANGTNGRNIFRLQPLHSSNITVSSKFRSLNTNNFIDITSTNNNQTVILSGDSDFSGFTGSLRNLGGRLQVSSSNPLLSSGGGVIEIQSGAVFTRFNGNGDLGADGSGLVMTIGSGETAQFNGGEKSIYADISGDGALSVTAGTQRFYNNISLVGPLTLSNSARMELHNGAVNNTVLSNLILDSSTATLVLGPDSPNTIASDILQGASTIELQGDGSSSRGITISAAQTLAGNLTINGGYLALSAANALASVPQVDMQSNGALVLGADQTVTNLKSSTNSSTSVVDMGSSTLTLTPTEECTYSGSITGSSGGGINHNSIHKQILSGDLSQMDKDLTTTSTGALEIQAPISFSSGRQWSAQNAAGAIAIGPGGVVDFGGGTIGQNKVQLSGGQVVVSSRVAGDTMTLDGVSGQSSGITIGAADSTISSAYGRTFKFGTDIELSIDSTGGLIKDDFGTLEIDQAFSTAHDPATTPAITVSKGKMKIIDGAITGASGQVTTGSDIRVAAGAEVELQLNTHYELQRTIDGAGDLRVTVGSGSNHQFRPGANAHIKNSGNFYVGPGVFFNPLEDWGSWEPGEAAIIEIDDTAGPFIMRGPITPQGSTFNPHFPSGFSGTGSAIRTSGSSVTINMASGVNELVIGNINDQLSLRGSGTLSLNIPAGKRMDLRYQMHTQTSTANIVANTGAGLLFIEGVGLETFEGVVRNLSTGEVWLKDPTIKTTSPGTKFSFGNNVGAVTTIELTGSNTLTLGEFNDIYWSNEGGVAKRGTGRLIFDQTPGMSSWGGPLDVYVGEVDLHKASRDNTAVTNVHKGAQLTVWRDFGTSTGIADLDLGNLTLNSGSKLLITDRDWASPAVAAASNERSQVVVSQLDTQANAEIIFAVEPTEGVTGSGSQSFASGSAMLKLEEDLSAGAPDITGPLYLRLAPLSSGSYTDNTVFHLMEFANAASATNFAAKVRLRPSIRALSSGYAAGQSVTNNTALFAQLYLGQDSGDSTTKHLVAHINSVGFAPGKKALAKTDYSSTSYTAGTRTVGYFLDNLLQQDFAAYSALDGLLAAVLNHEGNMDYHLSLLTPQSYGAAANSFAQSSGLLHSVMGQGLTALAEQQRWAGVADAQQCQKIFGALESAQNLSSETKVASKGRAHSWESQLAGLSFQSEDASHRVDAHVVGAAINLSPSWLLGYQHALTQEQYQQHSGHSSGSQSGQYGRGLMLLRTGSFLVQAQSTLGVMSHTHQRSMVIDLAEGLQDRWEAVSAYHSYEMSGEITAHYTHQLSSSLSLQPGFKSEFSVNQTPKYTESGAGNLNLVIESQTQAYALVTPMLSLDYRVADQKGFAALRLNLGYQSALAPQCECRYGLKEFELRESTISQHPQAISTWVVGSEAVFLLTQGVSFQAQYHAAGTKQQRAQLRASWEF